MSDHRRYRPRRNRALLALVIAAGFCFALMAIGLISGLVTGLILFAQLVADLAHGY
jgi:hypothetical protein